MHSEAIFDYLIYNGTPYRTDDPQVTSKMLQRAVYEVIRVVDGIPLYYKEHIDRLYLSAELANVKLCLQPDMIESLMQRIIKLNGQYNANVKILFSEDGSEYFVYFMHTFYPPESMVSAGVHTILYDVERHNPNAKINAYQFRSHITEYREERNAFEALLVDKTGCITEGSRTNIFFVDDNSVYTATSPKVLIGITRLKVIEVCKDAGITVHEEAIPVAELNRFNGAFITSTSNDILPIKSVADIEFNSVDHPLIIKIQQAYQRHKQANLVKIAADWKQ